MYILYSDIHSTANSIWDTPIIFNLSYTLYWDMPLDMVSFLDKFVESNFGLSLEQDHQFCLTILKWVGEF
jgi:hypothetical protein